MPERHDSPIGVGLFGLNGHQVHEKLRAHPRARLVGTAGAAHEDWPAWISGDRAIRRFDTLDEMLGDPAVRLVVLCSPMRSDQPGHALACLRAGRHVYAEKPCALTEPDLDAILAAAAEHSVCFREMNDTLYTAPFHGIRRRVLEGAVGDVVQVHAQKSYPLIGKRRPTDDDTDGGLLRQVGVHAVRMVEHVAGQRVSDAPGAVQAAETVIDYPLGGRIVGGCSLLMKLESGGIATADCNYLNPAGFPGWGNESVRVFGTGGMIEATDAGVRTRWVTADRDEAWQEPTQPIDPFDAVVDEALGLPSGLLPLADDLHPTRVVIRAFRQVRGGFLKD